MESLDLDTLCRLKMQKINQNISSGHRDVSKEEISL